MARTGVERAGPRPGELTAKERTLHQAFLAEVERIPGGDRLSGTTVDPHNDHRLAMSLAVIGLRVQGISVKNETCVNKSFPQFWDFWDEL